MVDNPQARVRGLVVGIDSLLNRSLVTGCVDSVLAAARMVNKAQGVRTVSGIYQKLTATSKYVIQ